MKVLHVAAMPFPTHQGTQAAVHRMASAFADAAHETHLLTYARGAFERSTPYTHHRMRDLPGDDAMRSGPSLRKLALDALLPGAVRHLHRELRPALTLAHHVEAALACAVGGVPFVFVAHTSLAHELATYLPGPLRRSAREAVGRAGSALDAALLGRAQARLAVSPLLAELLERTSRSPVHAVPVPWAPHAPFTDTERAEARDELGLAPEDDVALYAGNLDAYQDWPTILDAAALLRSERPRLRTLWLTGSDPAPLAREAEARGLMEHTLVRPLDGDQARRRAHAAADVALVPRGAAGGLPIKLLDAFAHGVPAVLAPLAAAGLPLGGAAFIAEDASPRAFERALAGALENPAQRRVVGEAGRAYLAAAHHDAAFLAAVLEAT